MLVEHKQTSSNKNEELTRLKDYSQPINHYLLLDYYKQTFFITGELLARSTEPQWSCVMQNNNSIYLYWTYSIKYWTSPRVSE